MKRALLICFVLMATVGACFAATLKLTTGIGESNPVFTMQGEYGSTVTKQVVGSSVESITVEPPAANDVNLKVSILQSTDARFKGVVTLSIEAKPFVNTKPELAEQKTKIPTIGERTVLSGVNNISVTDATTDPAESDASSVVNLKIQYDGPRVAHEGLASLASWTFTWPKNEDLAPGDYESTVVMSYTTT